VTCPQNKLDEIISKIKKHMPTAPLEGPQSLAARSPAFSSKVRVTEEKA
jgi:hypothetical protein